MHITLAVTLQGGVNDDEVGPLVEFAVERPWITGISFQPATYSGRHVLPAELERRITFPDVIKGVAAQTGGMFREDDFMPLPCAHPNCHSLSIAYRHGETVVPLSRFFDARNNLDLLANGIAFTRPKARDLIMQYLGRQGCCSGGDCLPAADEASATGALPIVELAAASGRPENGSGGSSPSAEFFAKAIAEQLGAEDLFRITITSFLDAYNFDVRRVMKCCTHHVLPSGHVIPFCAYNVLYREGHVALPALNEAVASEIEMDWAYAAIMLTALLSCGLLLRRSQAGLGLLWWQKIGIGMGAFCGAMIGAKLPFIFGDWEALLRGTVWLADGKTIMCGIVGGLLRSGSCQMVARRADEDRRFLRPRPSRLQLASAASVVFTPDAVLARRLRCLGALSFLIVRLDRTWLAIRRSSMKRRFILRRRGCCCC